ncbi:unnamed protein product, partial [Rotaria sp. Silwood2]
PLVVARDVFYSTPIRSRAIISFVGEIKLDWMNHSIKREFSLTAEEETYLNNNNRYDKVRQLYPNNIQMLVSNKTLKLTGRSDVVLNAELQLRKEMITELTFKLENRYSPKTTQYKNLADNLEKLNSGYKFNTNATIKTNNYYIPIFLPASGSLRTVQLLNHDKNGSNSCLTLAISDGLPTTFMLHVFADALLST